MLYLSVRCQLQNFEYKFNEKQLTLIVTLTKDTVELEESVIIQQIQHSEYSSLSILYEHIKIFVKSANTKLADIKKDTLADSTVNAVVAKTIDAKINIILAEDKMSVLAQVTTAIGGKLLDLQTIKQTCLDAGVRYGLKSSLIDELLLKCKNSEPGSSIEFTIVRGMSVIHGEDAYLKPRVALFSDACRTPKVDSDGRADLKDLGNIETAMVNQAVLEKIPLIIGKEGIDIYGDKIPPYVGKDINFSINDSVSVNPKNPNILLASKSGLVRFDGKTLIIDDVFTLPELDPKKGHIKFKGSVIIQGDVSPDMHLTATGDVFIGGFVESAIIKCGGELTIISGASGRLLEGPKNDHHYSCVLQSGGQINLTFANQCEITAKTIVSVKKQLSHCNVEANSVVVGQGDRPSGLITGCRLFLCKTLEAGVIGTESDVRTDISMNRTYDIFINKEIELADWIHEIVYRLENVENDYNNTIDLDKKHELESALTKLQSKVEKYTGYRNALISKRREYMDMVSVTANSRLYANVSVVVAEHSLITKVEKGPSVIKIEDHEFKVQPKS